ncbi:hypothetical protein GOV04_03215 [Candidatus Woesearchaeota archaeon]|nr:hypothetical protein [Candidatus Woesearchaeota archaeon]
MRQRKQNNVVKHLLVVLIVAFLALTVNGLPSGPTLTHVENSTSPNSGTGTERLADPGGYITTLLLNTSQQVQNWKAYVGNVTGKLTLDDSDNWTIYDWTGITIVGEVYISRNQTVQWTTVNCTNTTEKETEDTFIGNNAANDDSINKTFSATTHASLTVAGRPIQNSSCYSIATYLIDNAQTISEASLYQEILLSDNLGNLVYTTLLNDDTTGYNNESYDFQAMVADSQAATAITYYFYVELGS